MTFKRITVEIVEFTLADALRVISEAEFRDFTKNDWMGYAGCDTRNPRIADITFMDREGDVILDGTTFEFHFYIYDGACDTYTINMEKQEISYQQT